MARNINKYPSREQIQKHMDILNNQIEMLKKENEYYESTIENRKKQFHTLLVSADEILNNIKENRNSNKDFEWLRNNEDSLEDNITQQDNETLISDNENDDDKEEGILEDKGLVFL